MPVDVESELARLGTAWGESIAHVDVAEVLERTMATRSQPVDHMIDPAATSHRRRAEPRSTRSGQRWLVAAACIALVVAGVVALAQWPASGPDPAATNPETTPSVSTDPAAPIRPPEPFVGSWVSTDTDGSSQTMQIVRSGDEYEVVVRDDVATAACAGAAATIAGTGLLETDDRLVIAQPELTCDDGTTPAIGLPPQADLADYTFFRNSVADELTDPFGVVWRRVGSNDGTTVPEQTTVPATESARATVPALGSATSGGMWPQSTLDEVRAAQESADAADPTYSWQLFAQSSPDQEPWQAQILTRFIKEGLGWEDYLPRGTAYYDGGGGYAETLLIRCAPGQTNPLATLYAAMPPEIRGCAPTIDELTYETVMLSLTQPERRGASGIWVVEQWEILQSPSEGPLFWLLYPDLGQVRQVVPPPEDDVTAFLEAFLQARVDGQGAEQYLLTEPGQLELVAPLLYATTSGVPYERFTRPQMLQGPEWPTGWREYKVQLFAEDETVVDQLFHVVLREGQLGLIYGFAFGEDPTTENGEPVAVPHSEFEGTLTFTAPPLATSGDGRIEIELTASGGRVVIAEDPLPDGREDCRAGTAPEVAADATALARSIEADPDFEATEPVPVSVAGIDGLQVDMAFNEEELCYWLWSYTRGDAGEPPWRMRLYMVDYPESAWQSASNWRPQVLTIAVIAPETDFDRALEEAAPIVESVEFVAG
ncbi:MAG: hypothetical protein WAS51_16450 [Ilumatobacteraceae bacterium]